IRTELGRQVREAFVAPPGSLLLSVDYSQIELRVLAHVSQDKALLDSFARGEDIHRRTASEIFGVEPDLVSDEMRRAAKAINFGIAYGLSAFGLAQRLDLPTHETQAIIDRYFARYSGVRTWLDQTLADARENQVVRTLWGRRRRITDLGSNSITMRQAAERAAVNMPIQGTAADLMKRAMIDLAHGLSRGGFKSKLLLQVHDELLLEVPEAELDAVKALAIRSMEGAAHFSVPLTVSVGVGRNWAEAH
ncbi:MAG: DNA polymerase I, partial [Myxococcales bacterium]|nr:DNA polymerase I [Myxococcales bacterium]